MICLLIVTGIQTCVCRKISTLVQKGRLFPGTSLTGRRSCVATTVQLTSRCTPSWRSRARTRSPSSGLPGGQLRERGKFNNCSIYLGSLVDLTEASSTTVPFHLPGAVWRGLPLLLNFLLILHLFRFFIVHSFLIVPFFLGCSFFPSCFVLSALFHSFVICSILS